MTIWTPRTPDQSLMPGQLVVHDIKHMRLETIKVAEDLKLYADIAKKAYDAVQNTKKKIIKEDKKDREFKGTLTIPPEPHEEPAAKTAWELKS